MFALVSHVIVQPLPPVNVELNEIVPPTQIVVLVGKIAKVASLTI